MRKIDGMRKLYLSLFFTISIYSLQAQQLALYNTETLYDSFENPSQKAFKADTSRKFAFNFFIPTVSANAVFTGPAQNGFKYLIYKQVFNGRDITLGESKTNTLTAHTNTYLAMFRIFKNVDFNRELGFAWQVRNDGNVKVSNESIAIFDNYKLFAQNQYDNVFNDKGYNQSYHQFSISYREDYDKKLSLGVKLSALSGISYNRLKVERSELKTVPNRDSFYVDLKGEFKSSFLTENVSKNVIYPTFKDPGIALSAGLSYKLPGGWFLMGNLKDLGFIRWSKDSYDYQFDTLIGINNASDGTADERLNSAIGTMLNDAAEEDNFVSVINGKAEGMVSKSVGPYKGNFIVSKNLFYPGGNIGLINNYKLKNFVFTVSEVYNTNDYFSTGAQLMIKSPNVEFFLGSDQIFKTIEAARSLKNDDPTIGNGHSGASAYLGFAVKFGPAMEHPANSNNIPGLEMASSGPHRSFFSGLFGIFRRR
ncbi:MAG: DUF5723 family protein [Daejeonella sp.]